MDVKQAVKIAKIYVADLFIDEGASNLGLEEVEFNPNKELWQVTVGFDRNWSPPASSTAAAAVLALALAPQKKRSYKVVSISDQDGSVVAMRQREGMD